MNMIPIANHLPLMMCNSYPSRSGCKASHIPRSYDLQVLTYTSHIPRSHKGGRGSNTCYSTTSMDIKQNVTLTSLGKVTDNLSYAPQL